MTIAYIRQTTVEDKPSIKEVEWKQVRSSVKASMQKYILESACLLHDVSHSEIEHVINQEERPRFLDIFIMSALYCSDRPLRVNELQSALNAFILSHKRDIKEEYASLKEDGVDLEKASASLAEHFRREFLTFARWSIQQDTTPKLLWTEMDVPRHILSKADINDKTTDRRSPPDRRREGECEECQNTKGKRLSSGGLAEISENLIYAESFEKPYLTKRTSVGFFN